MLRTSFRRRWIVAAPLCGGAVMKGFAGVILLRGALGALTPVVAAHDSPAASRYRPQVRASASAPIRGPPPGPRPAERTCA